jgi:predicted TIM-barrel fold metal-dependent hydrolase
MEGNVLIPPVISVDDHVVEPPDLWQRRLPARLRDAGPKVVRVPWEHGAGYRQPWRVASSGPEVDCWVVEDIPQFVMKSIASAGYEPDEIDMTPISFDDMRPGCYDVKARLADMDVINVERSLCFPNSARFCGQLFLWMQNKEAALACVQAYNDWMVEEWAGESDGRLVPLCLIPLWDPQAAAAEVRRNAARGVRAVAFSELPAELGLPSIHDAAGYWVPFIEACDETSTVLCIHIGSSSSVAVTSPDAPLCVTLSLASVNSMESMADWLFSGLLARYPNLKLAYSESQIGWMPYLFERVDRIWRVGNKLSNIHPSITQPPSSYVAGRVFGCFFEDDFGLESRDVIGVDQITFESDYPHQDSTWPNTTAYIEKTMSGLSDLDRYKILRGNAIRMLDLAPTPGIDDRVR